MTELERLQEIYKREREAHVANIKAWQACEQRVKLLEGMLSDLYVAWVTCGMLKEERANEIHEIIRRLR